MNKNNAYWFKPLGGGKVWPDNKNGWIAFLVLLMAAFPVGYFVLWPGNFSLENNMFWIVYSIVFAFVFIFCVWKKTQWNE